jgi:cell division protein FtsL
MDGNARTKSVPRKSGLFMMSLLLLFLIVGSLIYVWSRIRVIQTGYEISQTVKAGRSLSEENKRLKVEAAALKSYARIEKIAVQELGMSKPKLHQVVVIR